MRRLLPAAVAAALMVTGCSTGKDAVSRGGDFQFVSPGGKVDITYEGADRQVAPDISGEDLQDPGKQLSTADFPGRVVVVNLWGSWCPPCRTEAPELEKLAEQTKADGVQLLGLDVREDDRQGPQDFVRDRGLTYPSIYDPYGRLLLALKGYPRSTVPSTIVFDKHHRIAAVYLRGLLASDLLPELRKLAAES